MPTPNAHYVSIYVTTDCNLRCPYCYAETGGPEISTIDLEFARAGIDDYFREWPHRGLRFQGGGEPTLRMDVIKELTGYARDKYGAVTTELQTNGFFDDEAARWIGDEVDVVWISLDGPSGINGIHRPTASGKDSTPVVERNVRLLIESPRATVGIRACVSTLNADRQTELVDYFQSLGVKTIYADNIFTAGDNEALTAKAGFGAPTLREYVDGFLRARQHAQDLGVFYGSWVSVNFGEQTGLNCTACIPYPRLTSDGYVSCCDVCYLGKLGPKEFVYGRWNADLSEIEYFEDQKRRIGRRELSQLTPCNKCKLARFCAGGCMGKAFLRTGDIMKPDRTICWAVHRLAKELPLGHGRDPNELEHP